MINPFFGAALLVLCLPGVSPAQVAASTETAAIAASSSTAAVPPPQHGVHISGWGAGSVKTRRRLIGDIKAAGLNTVVIALKEYDGIMFVPGVPLAKEIGSYARAIPDLPGMVKEFHDAGLYTVGRIALFKDDTLARRKPELAVHRPDGSLWLDKKCAWADPYRKEVWQYNIDIASRAVAAGFDEIQFDYIRFPADGDVKNCRYSKKDRSKQTDAADLVAFLDFARTTLKPMGAKLSIAIFGLTTTANDGMGIGQHLDAMGSQVDYVSPMMYPSHYHKGEYGIPDPNRDPYKTIHLGLREASDKLGGEIWRLRPYLQDFSLFGVHYGPDKVKAQILAAQRMGVNSWILWNPQNRYTWSAIPKEEKNETH